MSSCAPQQFEPLLELVGERTSLDWEGCVGTLAPTRPDVACHVPIIHGCDLMCTFCIIPYRRGRQVSRPVDEIAREVELLVSRGVREVTVLGQTVDAYGHDLTDDGESQPDLATLLTRLNGVDGLERIRFLTSHPNYMSRRIIEAVADLPKGLRAHQPPGCRRATTKSWLVCDATTPAPNTSRWWRKSATPFLTLRSARTSSWAFTGETEQQFRRTLDLVEQLRMDKVHCAAYSTRPGTIADRTMPDDVPHEAKVSRRQRIDALQESILTEINGQPGWNRVPSAC